MRQKEKPRGSTSTLFFGSWSSQSAWLLLSPVRVFLYLLYMLCPGFVVVFSGRNIEMYFYSIYLAADIPSNQRYLAKTFHILELILLEPLDIFSMCFLTKLYQDIISVRENCFHYENCDNQKKKNSGNIFYFFQSSISIGGRTPNRKCSFHCLYRSYFKSERQACRRNELF